MADYVGLRNAYAELVADMGDDILPFSAIARDAEQSLWFAEGDLEVLLYVNFSADERNLVKNILSIRKRYDEAVALLAVGRALSEVEPFWLHRAKNMVLDIIYELWEDVLR